jgi:hypothetical protein
MACARINAARTAAPTAEAAQAAHRHSMQAAKQASMVEQQSKMHHL